MKNLYLFLILAVFISGCSIPASTSYPQIYSLVREEKRIKRPMSGTKKEVSFKDFKETNLYEEDYVALKEETEKYITDHPGLDETTKNNLRELKLTVGNTKQETLLLLGEPDKISKSRNSETWIYRTTRLRAFTIFILPVFFAHEGYYLRFNGDTLVSIEKHHPQQIIHQASGAGLNSRTSGAK